ncbi:MAG: BatA domain-containing protein, partial [Candidatus Hydrogenedentes bacterium]|nr:BatA domain-containing protein [Candidatus Hydrogenedentota bacterium]
MVGLAFLTPLFLAGAATAAIPLIIHLIHRRRAKVHPFSTLMFLRLSNYRVARRERLRELIMLLLRCALLLLLAFAFAGPVLRHRRAAPDAPVHAAVIVDDSFSMGYRHGGETSFERARRAAAGIVESLPKDSEAALFFFAANSDRELPELTPSMIELKKSAMSATVSASAAAAGPAISRAAGALASSPWPNRELYVLTDLQKIAWQDVAPGDDFARLGDEELEIIVVDCGGEEPENTAVEKVATGLRPGAGASELRAVVDVRNFGRVPRDVALSLRMGERGGELRAADTARITERGAARIALEQALLDGQEAVGCVEAAPDSLPLDDVRYVSVSRSREASVLIVGARRGGPRGPDDVFYLKAALEAGSSPLQTFSVTCDELPAMELGDYAVVVAGQLPGLTAPGAAALRRFVRAGGGLLMFLGPDVTAPMYNELLGASDANGPALLPARLGELRTMPDDARATWDEIDFSHNLFDLFAGSAAKELSFVRTGTYFALDTAGGTNTGDSGAERMRVLAAYAGGAPAVVEGACGDGAVILFTTSCDGGWSGLPLRASFVPIVHRAVAHLTGEQDSSAAEHTVGQPIEFAFPIQAGSVSIEITAPDGSQHIVLSEPSEQGNRAAFRGTGQPGLYRINALTPSYTGPRVLAVNVDTAESDLARISPQQMRTLLPGARVVAPGTLAAGAGGAT